METKDKIAKKPKLSIKHYLNTKLKPHKRRDTDDFFIYPVYVIVRYKQQKTFIKSRYYPMFSEKEFAENPVPNDYVKWWVNLEKEIISKAIEWLDDDNSFNINLLPSHYKYYSDDIINDAINYIFSYVKEYGHLGEPDNINFSKLTLIIDKLYDYKNFHLITVFEWATKPELKEKYKLYLESQMTYPLIGIEYIPDLFRLLNIMANAKMAVIKEPQS